MALISRDGIIQKKTNIPLYLLAKKDIAHRYGTGGKWEVQRPDGTPILTLQNELLIIAGSIKVQTFFFPNDAILNTDYISESPAAYGGASVKRLLNTAGEVSVVTDIVSASDKITSSALDSIVTADKLIYLTGTEFNDGLYEVSSVSSNDVFIKTSGVAIGIKTSLIDEAGISASLSVGNPAYFYWNESNTLWEFGYFDDSFVRHSFKAVGLHGTVATDFSDVNPNLAAVGTTTSDSGSKQIGLNLTGFLNITQPNIQDALEQVDGFVASPAVPAFVFGEAGAAGSVPQYAQTDSTIALFQNALPAALDAGGSGTKGAAVKASRHDHEHPTPTAVPIDVGTLNQEGTSTDFARSDHVHRFLIANGAMMKSGIVDLVDTDTTKSITYATPFPNNTTIVKIEMYNAVDATPLHYLHYIRQKTENGFVVNFSAPIEGANYKFMYFALGD